MKAPQQLFDNNRAWVDGIKAKDPGFFANLAKRQTPEYLWIGCSDSRVPATRVVDLPPGEMFVHRNIANVVAHTDLNSLSVIQYAVAALKVKHIIVCGHYGCGGVAASQEDADHGLIDNWLHHIKDVARLNEAQLQGLEGADRINRLCELNVIEQVRNVCNTPPVKNAWANGAGLAVHGLIYDLKTGVLKDLDISVAGLPESV